MSGQRNKKNNEIKLNLNKNIFNEAYLPHLKEYDKRINDSIAAINNRLNTELANLKNSIQVQAFAWANPGTVPTPSGYSTHNCIYLVLRGEYGSYGVQDLLFYSSMGHPEYVEGYTKGAHNSVFVICSRSWWFAWKL